MPNWSVSAARSAAPSAAALCRGGDDVEPRLKAKSTAETAATCGRGEENMRRADRLTAPAAGRESEERICSRAHGHLQAHRVKAARHARREAGMRLDRVRYTLASERANVWMLAERVSVMVFYAEREGGHYRPKPARDSARVVRGRGTGAKRRGRSVAQAACRWAAPRGAGSTRGGAQGAHAFGCVDAGPRRCVRETDRAERRGASRGSIAARDLLSGASTA